MKDLKQTKSSKLHKLAYLNLTLLFILFLTPILLGQMYVDGPYLYTDQDEQVILRGVNKMIYYNDRDGIPSYPEIAKTGANVTRIFWFARTDHTPAQLDETLGNCIDNDMIPMPSLWDATGDWSQLWTCVNYWTRSDIVPIIQKYQRYLLLNIANEAGDYSVSESDFQTQYRNAIIQMRNAGIHVPIVIDAAGWGRAENYLLNTGQYLLNQDPDHNLMFSWHPWDVNQPHSRYDNAISEAKSKNLCLIIGEFSQYSVGCACCIDYQYIIQKCQQEQIGWMAWSWGPGNGDCALMDMTTDGYYNTLHDWGLEVAVTNTYSIQNTSVRPGIFGSQPVTILTTSLPNGIIDQPYNETISFSGGVAPYTWSIDSGSLPPGLGLNDNVISGTPTSTGTYNFTVKVVDNNNDSDTQPLTIQVLSDPQQPYSGSPIAIPGTIEAENYDVGGEGIAYHDTDSGNNGGAYRTDAVDIENSTEGAYNVGWIQNGEWLEYTVDVATTGTYDIEVRVASASAGGTLHIEFDGTDVTGPLSFSATGGWQNWTTVNANGVTLSAGEQIMRIAMDASDFNVNWVNITGGGDTTPPAAPVNLVATAGDGTVSLNWDDNSEPDLASYNVYRSTTSGGAYNQIASGLMVSDYSDNNVTNGTTYYYVVTAVDDATNESAYSNEAGATPASSGEIITINDNTTGTGLNQFEYVGTWNYASSGEGKYQDDDHWSSTTDAYYQVDFQGTKIEIYATKDAHHGIAAVSIDGGTEQNADFYAATRQAQALIWASSTLTYGTHTLKVRVTGNNNPSSSGVVITADRVDIHTGGGDTTPPAAPTNLVATAGDGTVSLNWNDNSEPDLASYKVYRSTSAGGNYSQIASDLTSSQFTDNNVTNGTAYYYVVTALDDSDNESAYSNEASATPQEPGGDLPSPWLNADVGSPTPGNASYASGTFTIESNGNDIWGTADNFHFVYQPFSGDGEIYARVTSLENTHEWAKSGVMIRENLNSNSRHAMMVVTSSNGTAFQRRTSTGGTSTHTGSTGAVPYWVRLVRSGNTLTGYKSTDGSNWTEVGSENIALPSNVYIGLAVTSHANGILATSNISNVNIVTPNNPPTVTITSPSDGATFTEGDNITIQADASDSDGSIVKVEFFEGANKLGEDTTSPYSYTWTNVSAGNYTLTAVATDNDDATTTSSPVGVTVETAGGDIITVNDNTTGTGLNQFEYVGTWNYSSSGEGKYQEDDHWSNTTDAYYQVDFEGTKIEIYATKDAHHGIAAVSIDGGAEQNADFYAATRQTQALIWASPTLANGTHTLKFRVTGTRHASSTGYVITADRVDIHQDGGSSGGTVTLNPVADTNTQSDPDGDEPSLAFSRWNHIFMKFDLSSVGSSVSEATLRLYYESSTSLTIYIHDATTDNWNEGGTLPSKGSTEMASAPASAAGWYEFDVTTYVDTEASGDDVITFTVTSNHDNWNSISAREGTHPPELVVTSTMAKELAREPDDILPVSFALQQNYPNPFNPNTSISYHLPESSQVELIIYDLSGHQVQTLVKSVQAAGIHTVQWNALNEAGQRVASGLYLYRIVVVSSKKMFSETKKMLLLK